MNKYNDEFIMNTKETLIDLANGIRTGKLSDGTKFDILEFLKRVPFKTSNAPMFKSNLTNFMEKYDPQDMGTITNYIIKERIDALYYFKPLVISYFYDAKISVNGREITKEDNDIIFDYLYTNEIPVIGSTYYIVRKRFLAGEITKEMVKKQKALKLKK